MPFENNEDLIEIDQIKNQTISSQIYDTIDSSLFSNGISDSGIAPLPFVRYDSAIYHCPPSPTVLQ